MIKQTISVEDIMSMDLIKSTGSWKNAKKNIKRLFDICLEKGFLQSWEFSTKKKVDSYRSLHHAKIHLYYANAYSAARFNENLQRALMILDEEMYVKETVRALDYLDAQQVTAVAEEQGLEAAKDLVSAVLTAFVDENKALDWDVEQEPDSLEALLKLDVVMVFINEAQKNQFFSLTPEQQQTIAQKGLLSLEEHEEEEHLEQSPVEQIRMEISRQS